MSRQRRKNLLRHAPCLCQSPLPASRLRGRRDGGGPLCAAWLTAVGLLAMASAAHGETARFWFSLSAQEPYQFGPGLPASALAQSPRLELVEGGQATLYLWFRPRTVAEGPHHPASNPFDRLISFSLDVAHSGSAAVANGGHVLNPEGRRFDRVVDSAPENRFPVTLLDLDPDADDIYKDVFYPLATPEKLMGLMGFTLGAPGPRAGIGPFADGGDAGSVATPTGPAWLVGAIDVAASSAGMSELFLQVGNAGMLHADERRLLDERLACLQNATTVDPTACPGGTFVAFGPASERGDLIYDHSRQRQITLTGDGRDASIEVRTRQPGDFDADGAVDGRDLLSWQRAFGPAAPRSLLDANGDGQIDHRDAAPWERDFGLRAFDRAASLVAVAPVPEPSAAALGVAWWGVGGRRRRASKLGDAVVASC